MSKELIIHSTPKGVDVCLLEDKKLIEIHQEKDGSHINVGDIFLAKVRKVIPSLNAAFVNVGSAKDGFLHYSDLGPQVKSLKKFVTFGGQKKLSTHLLGSFKNEPDISKSGTIDKVLSRQNRILVQVVKEPISTKGPRITSEIGIPGRSMVLSPFTDFVGISRKIEDVEERKRLKRLISSIKPEGFGVIVRTNATSKKVADLHEELESLVKKWESLVDKLKKADTLPAKVFTADGKTRQILRDYVDESIDKIHVDDPSLFEEVKEYIHDIVPSKEHAVQLYSSNKPIFSKFDITKQLKSTFGKEVKMDSGAYLVIEHTEALHVIDVNSGNSISNKTEQSEMALRINLESADEIVRQLRLRDIGGIIIVDFIDMKDADHRNQVYQRVKEGLQKHKAKFVVLPLTRFGLMQITRQRTKPIMDVQTKELCPTCEGTGKVTSALLLDENIEDDLDTIITEKKMKGITIEAHPIMVGFLRSGMPSIRSQWSWRYKQWIKIKENQELPLTEYHFLDKTGEMISL